MTQIQFTVVGDGADSGIIAFIDGQAFVATSANNPSFGEIVQGCIADDPSVAELFDTAAAVARKFESLSRRITTDGESLFLDGDPLNSTVANQVMEFMAAGVDDWQPLVAFIENTEANPNPESVEQLYNWIEAERLTLTEDGYIVGYKGVERKDDGSLVSVHSGRALVDGIEFTGQIPNEVGTEVSMPRSAVEFNPARGCSNGLHVGTYEYASGWAKGALLEVHVNPADVVSVPTDCGAQKMRVSKYFIVGDEVVERYTTPLLGYDSARSYTSVWGELDEDEPECEFCGDIADDCFC